MRRFLIQVVLFSVVLLVSFCLILTMANGYTDPFYLRFTTPQQENLIIGTSRAAQGVNPALLEKVFDKKIYNYAFTVDHSPFGETYLNSIKNKIKKGDKPGTFIVAVDPWSISSKIKNPNDSTSFREVDLCLGNTQNVNSNPNLLYLIKNLGGKYHTVLTQRTGPCLLHENGWLDVSIGMDSLSMNDRIDSKVKIYRENNLPRYKYSSVRFRYLKETIKFLKGYGKVYLVRLPIHPKIMAIENELMPDFNEKIKSIVHMSEGYYDMTDLNEKFLYTDGNHLHKTSGAEVSTKIANWMSK